MILVIGTGSATGTTVTIPSGHDVGDLLIIFAFNGVSTTFPTLPSGWTNLDASGVNACAYRCGYRIATSAAMTSGTWTTASQLLVYALRGTDKITPIPASGSRSSGSSSTVTYSSRTLIGRGGNSMLIGFAGHTSIDTTLESPPTGLTNRIDLLDATDEVVAHDALPRAIDWPSTNVAVGGTSSGWHSYLIEVVQARLTFNNFLHASANQGNAGVMSVTEKTR